MRSKMGYETETYEAKDEGDQVEELKSFIETEIKCPYPSPDSPTMHRVPIDFGDGRRRFFKPKLISIGPLHYHLQKDSPAQELKKLCANNFMERLGENGGDTTDRFGRLMSTFAKDVRKLYRDIDHDCNLAEIMLLDSCFIMDLLLRRELTGNLRSQSVAAIVILLQEDLLKIENQLPFDVLQALAGQETPQENLMDLACDFFNIPKTCRGDHPQHLLEFALNALFPPCRRFASEQLRFRAEKSLRNTKGAYELKLHGIQFEFEESTPLTKFEFQNGKFKIPQLVVQESTEAIFWNFLIYEMYFSSREPIFASYVMLMDTLINSEKDVRVLLDANILVSRINDANSLVSLFNNLSANVNQKDFYFVKLIEDLNRYCRSSFAPLRAHVVRHYNDMSWNMVNSILLFILTVTQTLFGILAYGPKGK